MTRPSTPPILSELRSPTSPATQVAALKALKNELIGHDQKKEMWVGLGVVGPMSRILSTHKGVGKRRYRDINNATETGVRSSSRTDEEEARLQAIIIVGCLAHGGPAYLQPLNAGSIFPPLLSILCLTESSPQLVLAALRALNTVADSTMLDFSGTNGNEDSFLKVLYEDQYLVNLAQILEQSSQALVTQQQISLAAALIAKTCKDEAQRKTLALSGVLEALATRLASFVVATGSVPLAPHGRNGKSVCEIAPATTRSRLSPILQAIGTIISNSKIRTSKFVCAPAFATIFPRSDADPYSWRAPYSRLSKRHVSSSSLDTDLLPSHHRESVAQASSFPPLGVHGTWGNKQRTNRGFSSALELTPTEGFNGSDDDQTALVGWLVQVLYAERGVTRLMASWVLTLLYRAGLANRRREMGLAWILVPMLVRMLDSDYKLPQDTLPSYDGGLLQRPDWLVMEHAPTVLAILVKDSMDLQKAAVDAGAIKRLSQLLKQSFDPFPATSSSFMWNPHPSESNGTNLQDPIFTSRLGSNGLTPLAHHVLQMRESVLNCLASIATFKDEYRKAIIENGVVPFVISSLKPYPTGTSAGTSEAKGSADKNSLSGNPTPVLLAACDTARALSRSVSTLRTSLVDAGLAAPLHLLLKHHDVEVQVAATAVVCNLVLDFSPMREALIEAGILKVMCEHAHSVNARLRLNSIWALKHLVHTASNALKMSCLEELGPGWLKQIICSDTEDPSYSLGLKSSDRDTNSGTLIAMGTPNAAGEQVDLLNAVEQETRSIRAEHEEDEDEVNMVDSIGALGKLDFDHKKGYTSANSDVKRSGNAERMRHMIIPQNDMEAVAQARIDDVLVQEQGLNLIRNLICGPDSSEMVDYIFRELGQEKLFDILAGKLRPKVIDGFNRDRRSAGNSVKYVPPQQEIVVSVCYILVHLAASQPRHRQLLISQSELLKLVVPLFNHHFMEIRQCCAWIIINLTHMDDSSDRLHCKSRAYELRKLGVYEKLEELESDPETDLRERAKQAIHQMQELLR